MNMPGCVEVADFSHHDAYEMKTEAHEDPHLHRLHQHVPQAAAPAVATLPSQQGR